MKKTIIAALGDNVAAISLDDCEGGEALRAVCLPCEQTIFYGSVLGGKLGWKCEKCSKQYRFYPRDIEGVNYFLLRGDDKRFTASQWVAGWMNLDSKDVSVEILL